MSLDDLKLNRLGDKEVETSKKVSMNTERREKQNLMWAETFSLKLIMKEPK